MATVWFSRMFQLPVTWHFSWFWVLAITHETAVNTCVGFCMDMSFHFLAWSYSEYMFHLLRHSDFFSRMSVFPPAMYERHDFPAPLPTFRVVAIFYPSCCDRRVMIVHRGLGFYFPGAWWRGTPSPWLICSLVKCLFVSSVHFLIELFLTVKFWWFFYFPRNWSLLDVLFADMFFPSRACLPRLMTGFLMKQKGLLFMKSTLPLVSFTDHAFGVTKVMALIFAKPWLQRIFFLCFLLKVFCFYILYLSLWSVLNHLLFKVWGFRVKVYFFLYRYSVGIVCWKGCHSSIKLLLQNC